MSDVERDPTLQALFAAADEPLEDTLFLERTMARIEAHERRQMIVRGALAFLFALALWGLSFEGLPVALSHNVMDLSSFGLESPLVAEALSPINSVAGVLTLLLLGLRTLYRRIFS